jgi:hypothetical protein
MRTSEMFFYLLLTMYTANMKIKKFIARPNQAQNCTTLALRHGKAICKGVIHAFLLNERNFIGRNHCKGTQKVDFQ